jgi:hypothetical protein
MEHMAESDVIVLLPYSRLSRLCIIHIRSLSLVLSLDSVVRIILIKLGNFVALELNIRQCKGIYYATVFILSSDHVSNPLTSSLLTPSAPSHISNPSVRNSPVQYIHIRCTSKTKVPWRPQALVIAGESTTPVASAHGMVIINIRNTVVEDWVVPLGRLNRAQTSI